MNEDGMLARFSFTLRIAGQAEAASGFSEVSGLSAEVTTAELREGGENSFVHRLPAVSKARNVICRRGMIPAEGAFYTWLETVMQGGPEQPITPKSLEIDLIGADQAPIMRWTLARAWPVKWSVAGMGAPQREVAVESVEFAYQSVTRA